MTKTPPPQSPSPVGRAVISGAKTGDSQNPRREFMLAVMNMSWQLAIVVLVPIVGGYKLDSHFGSTPLITLVGFLVALGGVGLVVWHQFQLFSPRLPRREEGPDS